MTGLSLLLVGLLLGMQHATEADHLAVGVMLAVPLRLSSAYLTRMHRAMNALVGFFSCALGSVMVVEIGYWKDLLAA